MAGGQTAELQTFSAHHLNQMPITVLLKCISNNNGVVRVFKNIFLYKEPAVVTKIFISRLLTDYKYV